MTTPAPSDLELIARFQDGDSTALDALLARHKGWAKTKASAYRGHCNSRIGFEDLLHVVYIAMITAAQNFDTENISASTNHPFLAFAAGRVRGEMKAFLGVSAFDLHVGGEAGKLAAMRLIFKARRAVAEIEQRLPGIAKSDARIMAAEALGVPQTALQRALKMMEIGDATMMSVDEIDIQSDQVPVDDQIANREVEDRFAGALLEAIMGLPARQRFCLCSICLEGQPNKVAAEALDITPQRAGQIAQAGLAAVIGYVQRECPDVMSDAAQQMPEIAEKMRAHKWAEQIMASIDMAVLAR